ncbi:MAG: methyltransferase domain-containing protein [Actinobacteria bacterium]|nr:methyltransferase domain-containing protein [Actinomycetota bacterium]
MTRQGDQHGTQPGSGSDQPDATTNLSSRIRDWWEEDAGVYDRSPSHALSDPREAAAWGGALSRHIPLPGARVLDVGAGTGALSLIAAALGHRVTALDFSSAMLARARRKAEERGLEIEFVVGSATEPPEGPFDAVIERHVLWTQPRPADALRAWREVCPKGRLVLYESFPGAPTALSRLREGAASAIRRGLRIPDDHHGAYDAEVIAALPLARRASVEPVLQALSDAGWRRYRVERLREVEDARRRAAPPLLGRIERRERIAVLAE